MLGRIKTQDEKEKSRLEDTQINFSPSSFSSSGYLTMTSVTSDHWHYPEEKPNGVLEGKIAACSSLFLNKR